MRQIYNMNEAAYAEEEETPPLVLAPPPAVLAAQGQNQQDILQCISACAQQTRLSLANLLPSRFVHASTNCQTYPLKGLQSIRLSKG